MTRFPAHYRSGNCHCHFLPRANDLWSAYNNAATVHLRQHLADSLINFRALNQVWLESSMQFTAHRPDGQANQVGILFQCFLQA